VLLTPAGKAVLFASGPVRLLLPPDESRAAGTRAAGRAGGRVRDRAVSPALAAGNADLFEALRARRLELARGERVPPYVVASDRTLRELAELRPDSLAQLEEVYGIGPAKAARYGAQLLEVVRASGSA
jgi:ATP-dependent DNA helicase RecQ